MTRPEVIKQLLTDGSLAKNPRRHWPDWIDGTIGADWPLASWVAVESMFTSDGADHQRLRALTAPAFGPRRIDALRPQVRAIVTRLIDDLRTAAPGEEVDLHARLAYPLPTTLICDLFGVPEEQRPEMRRVVDGVLDTTAAPDQAQANLDDLFAAMHRLVADKRNTPGDDMTSELIAARDATGSQLTEQELVSTLILMIGAGSETAVNLIDHATALLLSHPEQLAQVHRGDATWRDVIEETLRLEPPIMHLPLHYAAQDIDLGEDVLIRTGTPVLLGFGAAGRDPHLHPDRPNDFDLTRPDKSHLAFGHGRHYCLGASLGVLEAEEALTALFRAFPDVRLAVGREQLLPQESFISNALRALPVLLAPAA
ncbi:cytochrome P450 [Kitasatospora herbaricolor]|uniref:cytochrome P450 family protein n=1 Tax=Kitasatospora herbaricolor TaxID=68217 RepID=UPI0019B06105|nr:cytochrome P450 [Kitasatospora herbaricolor]MDQ0305777.1 cytochrome P450 [Kitasatospora herbaricolor]GGV26872.1 cytochrome P450 [Kitasatospora herbaricolor]